LEILTIGIGVVKCGAQGNNLAQLHEPGVHVVPVGVAPDPAHALHWGPSA
jgi:hypothetical protein